MAPRTGPRFASVAARMDPWVLWVGRAYSPDDVLRTCEAAGCRVRLSPTREEVTHALGGASPSIGILETVGEPAADAVRALAAEFSGIWILALVERVEDVPAVLAAGASDALTLPAPEDAVTTRLRVALAALSRARKQAVRIHSLEEHLVELEHQSRDLQELAHRDDLTGLGNRRSFRTHLEYAIEFSRRYGGPVSVLVADLDGMKRLNDGCGHPTGDVALRGIAEIFRASIRGADLAARLGGDEFAVVMPATHALAAARVAERIRARIEDLLLPGGFSVSASFGVATIDNPRGKGFAADELFARADAALYSAKRGGKNRVEVDGLEAMSVGAA